MSVKYSFIQVVYNFFQNFKNIGVDHLMFLEKVAHRLIFCLLDRFHQLNRKGELARLYKPNLVIELAKGPGRKGLNTQVMGTSRGLQFAYIHEIFYFSEQRCEQRNRSILDFVQALKHWMFHAMHVLFSIIVLDWNRKTVEKMLKEKEGPKPQPCGKNQPKKRTAESELLSGEFCC